MPMLEGKQIERNPKALEKYIGKKIMSVHNVHVDACSFRPQVIVIEKIEGRNLFLDNGDVGWIPDYKEFAEIAEE